MPERTPEEWMRCALELAQNGFSAPNPHVGCVIVREGEIVGQGASEPAGGAHAEIVALRQAGLRAQGADVYVTLEPCNHQGRTGPCSHALFAAGVGRVFIGAHDPNPVALGGADYLCERGIEVVTGILKSECEHVHRAFLYAVRNRRVYVLGKIAITADGFSAREDGTSKWITNEEARADGHRLRAEMGAVLVGRSTIELDNPQLTARIPGVAHQPQRYVIDPYRRLATHYTVFKGDQPAKRVVAEEHALPEDIAVRWSGDGEGLNLVDLVEALYDRGHIGVLVEGGSNTVSRFVEEGLVQEMMVYQATDVNFETGIKGLTTAAQVCIDRTFSRVSTRQFGPTQVKNYLRNP